MRAPGSTSKKYASTAPWRRPAYALAAKVLGAMAQASLNNKRQCASSLQETRYTAQRSAMQLDEKKNKRKTKTAHKIDIDYDPLSPDPLIILPSWSTRAFFAKWSKGLRHLILLVCCLTWNFMDELLPNTDQLEAQLEMFMQRSRYRYRWGHISPGTYKHSHLTKHTGMYLDAKTQAVVSVNRWSYSHLALRWKMTKRHWHPYTTQKWISYPKRFWPTQPCALLHCFTCFGVVLVPITTSSWAEGQLAMHIDMTVQTHKHVVQHSTWL